MKMIFIKGKQYMRRKCGKWGNSLRKHGYRSTIAREKILETLEYTTKHLSTEDILNMIKIHYSSIGLTTVYRTLEILVNLGLVNKFDFGDGRSRYELSENITTKTHHHHLVCTSCGKIIDYSDFLNEEIEFLNKIEKKLGKKYDFKIEDHFIRFTGLCTVCLM